MKFGIESNVYKRAYGIEKGAEMLAKHGYVAIDYQDLVNTETEFFRSDEKAFESVLRMESEIYKGCGIEVSQAHGPWRYPPRELEPSDIEERFNSFCKAARGTAYLGSRYMVVHPLMPFGADSPDAPDTVYEINFDFYSRLCEYAKDLGVTVCLENMPFLNLPISSPRSIADFVRAVGADNFKVCLDTGHANIFGIKQSDAMKDIGHDLLAVLHIHDNDGKTDSHLNPFKGTIDWSDFGQGLADLKFGGVLSLETSPDVSNNDENIDNACLKLINDLKIIQSYIK